MSRFPIPGEDPERDCWRYLPEVSDTVSCQDCTGLMPSLPQSREEFAAYQDLSSMAIPMAEEFPPPPRR